MIQKKEVFEIFKTGTILFAITAIAAGVLATVNGFTAPIIATNAERKRNAAMTKVLPDAENFEKVEYQSDNTVAQIYRGDDKGYVVLCEPNGYGGTISLVVGVDTEGVVTGIDITSQSETAGLGSNCVQDQFKNQFVGKTNGITVVKQGAKDNQIDAISSATITSKAVTSGVNDALSAVMDIVNGGVSNEE